MAKPIIIKENDLTSDLGVPSVLQMILHGYMTRNNWSINQLSAETGLHHHTLKMLVTSNGSSQGLTRASKIMLGSFLNLKPEEVERFRSLPYDEKTFGGLYEFKG